MLGLVLGLGAGGTALASDVNAKVDLTADSTNTLTDATRVLDAVYGAFVPLTAGSWSVTVKADELPGGPRALPFSRTWPATLQAGQPLDLGASASSSAGRGSGRRGPAIAITGGGLLAAVVFVVWRRRRRTWIREAALG